MAHQVTLTWTASTTVGVSGYNVYRGINPPGNEGATPINAAPVTGTTYVDTAVTAGEKVDYVVTAILDGVESVHSTEVTATVPIVQADVNPPTNLVAVAL